jgi:hypothetical protein
VKSLSKIREKYGLNPQVQTTVFELGIVSKNRPYEWNEDWHANENTALHVLEQSVLYPRIISSINDIIKIQDIETGFKIDFRKIWPCIGFARHDNAKRSLLRNFKEGVDFEVRRAAEVVNELPGLSEDLDSRAEIIMLTLQCTLDFFTIVNMPMAKLYSRKMNAFMIERSKERDLPAVKLETISITKKLAMDAQDVELLAKTFKNTLLDDFNAKLDDPMQMEFKYVDDMLFDRRALLLNQVSEILTRPYCQKQVENKTNEQAKLTVSRYTPAEKNGRALKVSQN